MDETSAPDRARTLVSRARSGERAAFGELYERHAAMVHGILIASVPPADADDLMQEAFLAAWSGLAELREPERFGAWLGGIARNLVRKRRAQRSHEAGPLEGDPPARDAGAEGAEILAVLRELPETYRETLALRLVEGLGGAEIAAQTGLSPGSVRVNLTRGMKLLRERLERRGLA